MLDIFPDYTENTQPIVNSLLISQCIELYTVDNEERRIGFYSLEMAADLELEPKPYHVIAFEDTNDCKNLGYIIQAQMDMFGNGNAFVVAQPPKVNNAEFKFSSRSSFFSCSCWKLPCNLWS